MNTVGFLTIPADIVPEQVAVVSDGRQFTYAETAERVRRLAGALARAGVGRGSRVAALHTNTHRYVEAYFATAQLGGVFIPINYRAKPTELEHMLGFGEVEVLFVGGRYLPLVEGMRAAQPRLRLLIGFDTSAGVAHDYERWVASEEPSFDEADVDDDDTSILMYTSGTTSLPKGVMLRYADFTAYVTANVELADGTPRGAALLSAPLYHIAGATNMMTTLWTGRRLVLMPQFEPRQWLELVERERVSHAFVVPTMMKHLLDQPDFRGRDLTSLEVLSYGGAPMPFPVIRRAIETFPPSTGFVNAFGQTETTSTLTVLGPDDHRLDGPPEEVERNLKRLTSVGLPLPDVEVRVLDEDNRELSPNEIGEVVIRTPRVMKGYAGQESATAALLDADGWLHTRDMGYIDEDGYIYLVGRKDDIIIRGGENIAPAEIEAVLHAHPAVDEAAVIGLPDVDWGQKIAAFVALRPGKTASAEELADFCRHRLASFKKPEMIRFVDALPKNPLGKILKKELRSQFAE